VIARAAQETAYYVYGVVPPDQPLPPLEGAGLDADFAPELISSGPLAAVASRIRVHTEPADVGTEDALARVLAHEAVLERLLEATPAVVPFRFGSACAGEADVVELLEAREAELMDALARLAGRVELGVKAYADPALLADAVSARDERLAGLRSRLAAAPAGTAHLLGKQLERDLAEACAEESARLAAALHDGFARAAVAACTNSLPEGGDGLRPVLNGAYLVERAAEAAFRDEAAAVEAEHADLGLRIDVTGPWPAYNFVGAEG
jgi:gas vesicle protein GvpL/GvpF